MRKITFHKLRKREQQVPLPFLPRRTRAAESLTNYQSDSENFHDGARALGCCFQKHDVSRKTDQSMIEAARCMFPKLLGEASDDLERVTLDHAKIFVAAIFS